MGQVSSVNNDVAIELDENIAYINKTQKYIKSTSSDIIYLSGLSGNVLLDFSLSNNFELTLSGNIYLLKPYNITKGQSGIIIIKQDAVGGRTLTLDASWLKPNSLNISLTTTSNAIDVLTYYTINDDNTLVTCISDIG